MEPDGDLRVQSSPLSGSLVNEQPSSEQMPGASEESLSGSLGKGTTASQKRVSRAIKTLNVGDWDMLDDSDNPPSRKKRRENLCLKEDSKLCPVPQQKNRKRNKKTSPDSELHSSLSSLSSAPSSLDCSLTPDVANVRIPVEESQNSEAKSIDLMPSIEDSSGQIRNTSFHAYQGQEFVSRTEIQNQPEQNKKNDAVSQPAVTAVTEKKMEEDSSRKVDIVGEQRDTSKKQCATSSVGPGQLSENTTNISNERVTQPVSKGDTDSRSSDLNVNVTSTEEKKSGSSTEYQNYGTKRSLPESEVKNSNSTEVTEEAKQQKSASNSKKAKVNAAQQEYVSEKGQKICTPVEESGGERRDSAAAGNQRPQRRNKASAEERNHEVPAVRQNHTPTENITVYFHAILSKDFKMNPEKHKVFILAGGISDYIDWKDHVCELNCTQDLGDHGYLIEGHTIISKENLDKEISYKYVVKRDKQLLYEFIYKPALEGFHVDRSLYLSSKLISGTDWHQYDDIICTKPEDSWWTTFKNQIPFRKDKEKDVVKGKCIAARIMLDSLFSILKTWSRINIKSFFQQFQQFYSVNKRIMLHEGCRKPWKELQFGEEQLQDLIMNYLMEQSSNILKQNTSMWDKLGLALITLTLVKDYNLQLSKKGLEQLCRFLCLENSPADVNETKCFREMFSECQGVEEKLIMLCNSCIEEKIHQWVWTLPVLYLFTVTDSECKIRTWHASEEKWARLEGIQYLGIRDQNRNFNRNLIMEKKHLLKGNQTLFRSWFCLLRLCDLVEFISGPYADPFDCLLGTFYRLKNLRIDSQNCQDVKKLLEKLLHILSEKKITIQQGDWKHSAVACEKLHEMCSHQVPAIPHYKLLATAVEIVSTVLALEPSEVSEMEFATTVYQSVRKTVSDWFHYCLPKPLLEKRSITFSWKEELEAWDHFLKIKFPNSSHSEDWKEALSTILKSRIKQEGAVEQIKVYCSHYEKIQKFNSVILQTFENCALEAIDSAYQKQQNLLELISKYDKNKLGKIISAAIIKSWPKDDAGTPLKDFQSILKHLFEWQDSRYLFVFNRAEENTLNQFTDEVRLLMTLAESSFQNAANELVTGHILIKDLELIIKYKTRFIKCTEQSLPNELLKGLKLENVLDLRRQEVLHVKKEQKYLGVLLDMLRKIQCYLKVDLTEVEQKHSGNLSLKTLDAVVKVRKPTSCSDDGIETSLHLSEELKVVSKCVHDYRDNHIFLHCWEQAAKRLMNNMEDSDTEQTLDMEEVYDCLFNPCYKEFRRIYDSLKLGDLTFAEVNALFKDFNNHYEELRRDFQSMRQLQYQDNGEWIDERIQQIQQYHELDLALDSAKVIDKVKEVLKLTGNFGVLQQLLNLTSEFQSFQEEKLSSMSSSLMDAKKLLQDITEKRRLCLEELALRKEFVNWVKEALEDKNELKVFVELASISAGENDMDVDRVACFHDAVFGYSSLLYDLKQEAGFVEFMKCLENVWKALESDHNLPEKLRDSARYLDWLKTIKESHGSVELSSISLATRINEKGIYRIKAPVEGQKVCLDTILDLTIQESHGDQEKIRQYSLEELQELMNKLMLMSGKEEQNAQVEKFSEVFSNIRRFALSFMNLYSAGNMLFRNWIANIYCSPESRFCINMNFNLNSICGLRGSGDVAKVLPAMCRKMESFLERWNQFMSEKRSQYFYLNYYLAEQLVYLCKELGSGEPSESALMMLSFIKHNCSRQDTETVSKLVVSEISKSFDVTYGHQASRREVTEHLEEIWGSYMENMGLFLPHCFDFQTLGRFLSTLADLERRNVERMLPQGLHSRQPNLILCHRSEILVSTISIYMNNPEETLPSYDEVLLCTPQTSYEQVELFMRRCLTPNKKEKKIYILLFADELSYDVGYKLEELYQKLHLKHTSDYQLVMFCNCEREDRYIPSVFSNFIIHMTPLRPLKDIQSYLGKHYKTTELGNPSTSIFKNNMCVGIVSSERAGMGKSLYIKRLHQKMKEQLQGHRVLLRTIRLIDPHVNERKILNSLFLLLDQKSQKRPMILHFDITSSVQTGISEFLFKLFILRYLEDTDGKIWLRKQCHLYVAEILQPSPSPKKQRGSKSPGLNYSFLDVFPQVTCRSPKEVLDNSFQNLFHDSSDPGVDKKMFCSEAFQRPFQYLIRENRGENLDVFQYRKGLVEGTPGECLQLFLIYCGVIDPSWSELRNFAWFLNLQLRNCETSVFCNAEFVQDTLQGFKNFVVKFMILMAKDFATPSLNISDESPGMQDFGEVTEEALAPFLLRKKWESEPHPYIFFNADHTSMTFIGFHLQHNINGSIDAINPLNGNIIKRNVMTPQLYTGLVLQKVPFNINFDALTRAQKIEKLCMVLGIEWPTDPDETYELTTDNILKMLAIEMRFRCGIPVVLMGETGCGKTRLIKYLCELRKIGVNADNMKLVKVHGGTTADAIYAKVREAEYMADYNKSNYQFDTILFFDEANTTEAVSCIKEVLCDHTIEGQPLLSGSGLQIIAACNPYRKHTPKMIQRLESAGLGYRVKAEDTSEKLGSIPLRQLVYRVHALPPSMIPLVWDFGQLNNITEKLYIEQIVQKLAKSIKMSANEIQMIIEVLFESQTYMRKQKDECSFISLRDVERCVEVFRWFHGHSERLIEHLEKYLESNPSKSVIRRDRIIWSLILSVAVCYHASLEQKEAYWRVICEIFPEPYDNEKVVLEEISLVQDLFLNGVPVRERIAKNLALKENVFMMVICIELKIPLFLIGKPGSSKSLAKTIVADAMQGQAAYSDLYKELKQIHLVSFQCSPHSTPEGIINTFKHCARFQEGKNLGEYVSVVVLDEIGLAEDSPKMPLKTLHPLLEDGCIDDDPLPHKKVGFVGISNWALDPAKMNRGIFVSRGDLNKNELIESAKGICSSERFVLQRVERFFPIFANAYEEICKKQIKEFFGLRDYYSLVKMLFALTNNSKSIPGPRKIAEVVLRNFSGKEGVEVLDTFMSKIPEGGDENYKDISTIDLVEQNIYNDYQDGECRYLLVLTENYAALQILQQCFFRDAQPEIIFGSSFPKDQEYTQICRNINRVKICMETGKMVVLLNLQNLYESLYDALNQYYVQLAGQKYVDLGLGTHRVKCRVHPKFRLIVIEEKEVVYKQFPIPLINRLEKQYLDINTVLNKWQKNIVEDLKKWVDDFVTVKTEKYFMGQQTYTPSDVFIGYHSDSCASVVLQVTENLKESLLPQQLRQKVQEQAQLVLLNCATPDSVVRLGDSKLDFLRENLAKIYFQQQQHTSFAEFLHGCLRSDSRGHTVFIEITTFSRLLTAADTEILEAELQHDSDSLKVLFLQQFDTEYSFLKDIQKFFAVRTDGSKILIIQTDFENGSLSAQLIASARYSTVNEVNKIQKNQARVFVIFITKLSRIEGGSSYIGFHGGLWQSVHIDDLRTCKDMVSDITSFRSITISQLFSENMGESAENPERTEEEEKIEQEMEVEASPISKPEILVLDTTVLLRSCVQSAVGMLRDQNEEAGRSAKRIEILLSLLSEEGNFLKITKSRLTCLLKKQEENFFQVKEWVLREASNLTALQEGGTFRRTLWKRIQSMVTPFLAYMISILDRDYNLDLLVEPTTKNCVKALWLFIFNELKLLDIPYVMGQSSYQTKPIQVQNYMEVSTGAGNKMPFSWKIKDYLEDIRVHAQHITNNEAHAEKFLDIFEQTPLGQHIACYSEEEKAIFFHCYVRDFILLAMGVTSERELNMLQVALLSCVEEMKTASSDAGTRVPSLPWVHLGYHQFRSRLQNFSRILAVYPEVLHTLEQREKNRSCTLHSQMVLDVFAALACTEMLSSAVLTWKTRVWLQQVKDLQMPIELVCAANCSQGSGSQCSQMLQEVKSQWNRVFSVSLFVEHVLLGAETLIPELKELVKKYIMKLDKCFQWDSDLKTMRTFSAVMRMLCQCKEDASQSFCRFGLRSCPICLGDPRDPVNLPCDHVFCYDCIKQWLGPGQMICPFCLVSPPDDYNPTVSEEHSIAIKKNTQFRKLCNNFFIDLVSTMCFKGNNPPEKSVIEELLNLMFVHKSVLKGPENLHTKSLSPFDDVVDKAPVIRSVVLKLLLKYSFSDVKVYIQEHLSQVEANHIMDKEDKIELYMLFISCFEDSLCEKIENFPKETQIRCLAKDGYFLENYIHQWNRRHPVSQKITIEYLQGIANLRLCMDRAAEVIFELHETSDNSEDKEKQIYLEKVRQFFHCIQNNWHNIYLVRKLTSQYGLEFTQKLLSNHHYHWIFPSEIIEEQQTLQPGHIDRFLVCGKDYKAIRNAVGEALIKLETDVIAEALKAYKDSNSAPAVHFLLTIFRELTSLYRCRDPNAHPKQKQCDILKEFIRNSRVLPSAELKAFAESLVSHQLPLLTLPPLSFGHNTMVIEMAVYTAVVLFCGQNRILQPLRNLAFSPNTMLNAFLPTMPEDMLAQAVQWMLKEVVHWYTCPNGHPCVIGECGQPMQYSRCVDCGVQIGGVNHRPMPNFQRASNIQDRTQTGHILGDPRKRDPVITPERELSPAALILIRLLTHLALLLGASNDAQSVLQIIKPQVQDPVNFLLLHINKDLEQLMDTLGKTADETTNVIHLILCSLSKDQHAGQWPVRFDNQLSTKQYRNDWEQSVARTIILPELKLLDKALLDLNKQISEDERLSSNPVVKIIYGDPTVFLSRLPKDNTIHSSRIWSCRKRISVEHLAHIVQLKGGKDTVPILQKFLQKEAELRQVKFLPEILALQKDLVKRFQNNSEIEHHTIEDFLSSFSSGGVRLLMKGRVEKFLDVWNKLRLSIETNGQIKLPKDYCSSDRTVKDPFEILLPRRRGLGLCATSLVSYLIQLHNDFVNTIANGSTNANRYSVSPAEVADLHMISYEVEKDLIPVILSNCQYSVQKGGEALQEFDLEKIEQQVVSRFLQGKPRITLQGIPTLIHRCDQNYEHLFSNIKTKLKTQSSLSSSKMGMIRGDLVSYTDICDALSVTEIILGFLATTGGDSHMTLTDYTENVLRMSNQISLPVMKALSRCQLKHAISLWQLLSSHKSEQLLHLKKDPFGEISADYKEELTVDSIDLLKAFLTQTALESFLQELHEMIMLKLKHARTGEEYSPTWSLKEAFIPYLEGKGSNELQDLDDMFPEDIQVSQCIAAWKIAATLKRGGCGPGN
ncbi:E3 ubiquitin-protein ligase RNF213-like isoform X2 [Crotalus tigris]|uniref:E3 ubiquitin-protein ligase RNF213-like isoform X2 n=1 Tax=Crotalus tigris TaxID=88082 RepID=UPI00192F8B04|nr:E3 ubiquitin-protein ligase RNF213-like isoform X2 [Crotalus tigris]